MPTSLAQTLQGWRKLEMRGALGLREAWVIPPVAVVTVRRVLRAPTVPAAALSFPGPGRSAFGQKTRAYI